MSRYCPACGRSVNEGTVSSLGRDHDGMAERAYRALSGRGVGGDDAFRHKLAREVVAAALGGEPVSRPGTGDGR
jgi:hypothetical protein